MRARNVRRRGMTLIEALMASVVTAVALTTALSTYLVGMMAWYRGEGNINAEMNSHTAITTVANELRQSMAVAVDPNGKGLSYTLPAKDDTGTMLSPIVSDGVARRIELDGTTINMYANGVPRPICTNVILTDPLSPGGTAACQVFTPGSGTTVRSVTVMVVTQTGGFGAELVTARNRETIYLRNVPQLD
jgi:type II secretory pathway pseudopilin PulG